MMRTQAEIARMKGTTRAGAARFIARESIEPAGRRGHRDLYDTEAEPLRSWLAGVRMPWEHVRRTAGNETPLFPEAAAPAGFPGGAGPGPGKNAGAGFSSAPVLDFFSRHRPGQVEDLPGALLTEAMQKAKQEEDYPELRKIAETISREMRERALAEQNLEIERAKERQARERAEGMAIGNAVRRGELVERNAVRLFMGRVYAVHSSRLQTLGLKLAAGIDALEPGPERRFRIQDAIDGEVAAALETVRKHLEDWVGEEDRDPAPIGEAATATAGEAS